MRVGADRARQCGDALGPRVARLHRTEVGEEQHVGRDVAHPVRVGERGVLQHRALRTHADREPDLLRRRRERAVHLARLGRAARHAGDHDRRLEPAPEQLHRGVDLVPRELRQRLVQQLHLGEQRRALRLDVALDAQLEVGELALPEFAHAGAPARTPRNAPAAIARRRGFERRSDGPRHGKPRRMELVEQRAVDAAHGLGGSEERCGPRREAGVPRSRSESARARHRARAAAGSPRSSCRQRRLAGCTPIRARSSRAR